MNLYSEINLQVVIKFAAFKLHCVVDFARRLIRFRSCWLMRSFQNETYARNTSTDRAPTTIVRSSYQVKPAQTLGPGIMVDPVVSTAATCSALAVGMAHTLAYQETIVRLSCAVHPVLQPNRFWWEQKQFFW